MQNSDLRKSIPIRLVSLYTLVEMESSPLFFDIDLSNKKINSEEGSSMDKTENIVEQKCRELLEKALRHEATDIHLVPSLEGYDILFNRNTKLTKTGTLPPHLADRMISFYKFLSSLDISDKRKPQSGSFHKQMQGENLSFRVSTIPAIQYKESVVIRLQKHNRIVPIDKLCMEEEWADKLRQASSARQGLFLVSGPTGSGKTTTMYSLTAHCANHLNRHVITLEDPVENKHSHLLQVQVNEQAGVSYSTGLKAILRHSPDVIMVGEIRDSETAKIAVRASLTGHLVFSTIHSKDPVGCIYRMMDFGVSAEELRQTLVCISAQRLIQKPGGEIKAVFEIHSGNLLENMTNSILKGERFVSPKEQSIDVLLEKYGKGLSLL